MREALRRLTAESVVYGLGQVGGRAVQLLLVPVLTRALTPGAFGVWELIVGYSQTALLVLVLGMDGALARFFYQEPDREARIRMVSSSLAFRIASGAAAAGLLALLSGPLSVHVMGGEVYRKYLLIGAATLPLTLVVLFANDVLRVTFQPWKFIVLNVAQTALVASLSLVLVLGLDAGVVGVLYGRLAGDGLAALLGLFLVRHALRPRFGRAVLARMLRYGVPAIPALLAFGAIASLDRFALQRARSLEEVAVYAVAMKFFTVVTIGASAFQLAYGPFAYARAQAPEAPRLYARVLAAYVAAGSLGALAVGLFAPEALAALVPAAYRGAAEPAVWLAFAAVALGTYTVTSIGIGIALKTPLLGLCGGGAALAAAAGHALLTPRFGAPGAAVATFLAYAAAAVITYHVAQRVHPLPYRGGRLAALFAAALLLALAVQRLAPEGIPGLAIKAGALAAYAAALAGSGIWKERPAPARG